MAKHGSSFWFLSTLILLPFAAWCRDGHPLDLQVARGLLDSFEEGDSSGSSAVASSPSADFRLILKDTNLCLSWGPDGKSTDPSLEECNSRVVQEWTGPVALGKPSSISGAKCITICDGPFGSACTLLKPPQVDVNLTTCGNPTLDNQLWEIKPAGDFVEVLSLQTNTCLTAGDGILTAPCAGDQGQLWTYEPVP